MTDWQGMTLAHNLGGAGNAEPPRPAPNGGVGMTDLGLVRVGAVVRAFDGDTGEDVRLRDAWAEWHQTK